jgi:hypothetical protein
MSGYAALKFGEPFLDPEHPLLAKTISAAPLIFQNVKFNHNDTDFTQQKYYFDIGKLFRTSRVFLNYQGNNPDTLLLSARIPMILLTLLFGLALFLFTRKLFGNLAAIFAVFFYATEPNILAHGRLVNTDVPGMGFLLLAVFSLLIYSERQSLKRLLFLTLALALAFLAKYSNFYFLPLALVLMEFIYRQQRFRPREHMLFVIVGVFAIISLFYGLIAFRTEGILAFLPTHYLNGLNTIQFELNNDKRFSYLLGEAYYGSRWYYFPIMFLAKTQLTTLVLFALTPLLFIKKKLNLSLTQALITFAPPVIFFALALSVKFNIGVRHILPTYPFVIILAAASLSALFYWIRKSLSYDFAAATKSLLLAIIIGARLWSVSTTFPGYLSYYNIAFGGTENGWKVSDDSNYDWGQDIKRFANLIKEKGITKIGLDNYTNDYAAKDYYKAPTFPIFPTDKHYKGYLALSTSVIVYHQYNKDNYSWVVDKYPILYRAGKSIFIYKID